MTSEDQDRPVGRASTSVPAGTPDGAARSRLRPAAGALAIVAAGLVVAPGAGAASTGTTTAATPQTTTGTAPATDPGTTTEPALPPASTSTTPAVPPASPTATTTTTAPAPSDPDAADAVREDDSLGDDSGGAGRAETARAKKARERREARQALARKHAAAARRRAEARKEKAKAAKEAADAADDARGDDSDAPEDAAGGTAGAAADPSLLGGDAELLRAPAAIPDLFISRFRIPPFLLPIYQAAGVEYGIRWEVLAAINEIETDYGRNLNVSSAGAQGWMQFMPATWKTYGTDADGDGRADPMDPVDAIFSAARYLKAAGAEKSLRKAIFAYNHADWYVDSVMLRARLISGLPEPLVSSLTGLTQGTLPVAGAVADPAEAGSTPAAGTEAPDPGTPLWSARPGDDRAAQFVAPRGTEVVAVQDGTIVGTGTSPSMGRWIRLRDVFGNRYTYAHLGTVAETYAAPESTAEEEAAVAAAEREEQRDPAPDAPATAGRQPALDAIARMQSGADPVEPAEGSPALQRATPVTGATSNGATTPARREPDETVVPEGYGVPVPPAGPGDPAAAAAPAGGTVSASARPAPAVPATPIPATPVTPATPGTPATPTAPTTPAAPTSPAAPGTTTTPTTPGVPVTPSTPGTVAPETGLLAAVPAPASGAPGLGLLGPSAIDAPDFVLMAAQTRAPSTATVLARGPLSAHPGRRAKATAANWAGVPSLASAAGTAASSGTAAAAAPVGAASAKATTGATSTAKATATSSSAGGEQGSEDRESATSKAPRIVLKPLKKGARVNGGTVLGTIGRKSAKKDAAGATETASMAFGVRPAGRGAPRIDPRPILDGWRLLSATAEREADERDAGQKASALFGIRAGSATAGQVLLLPKEQLQARVLADDRIDIPAVGRAQIRAGLIDRRVLATLAYLAANGHELRISSLRRPGSITTSGNLSEHDSGNAVDIAAVDGETISPKTQGAGSVTDRTVRLLLRLQGTMTPHQIITLMGPEDFGGAENVLAMSDHDDHIHVGFSVAAGDGSVLGRQLASALKPGQWDDLVERLGKIQNPEVATKPSRFALKVRR